MIIFISTERGKEGEREREKYKCVVASLMPPTGNLACNPGMCPDWESNWQPFGSQPELNPLSYTSQGNPGAMVLLLLLLFILLGPGCPDI